MTVSKKQQAHVNNYINKKYDRINLTLPKGYKEKIREQLAPGESVNAYIKKCIDEDIRKNM